MLGRCRSLTHPDARITAGLISCFYNGKLLNTVKMRIVTINFHSHAQCTDESANKEYRVSISVAKLKKNQKRNDNILLINNPG